MAVLAAASSVYAGVTVPNDDFANATLLSGNTGSTTGNNASATAEVGEPTFIDDNGSDASIWWRWTAPESGRAVFDTLGTGTDTILGVYTGTNLADLVVVEENDENGNGTSESRVTFDAVAGTEYFIVVDSFTADDQGPITLNWLLRPPATLNEPTMVYSLRQVQVFQGGLDEGVYQPRVTMVNNGLVVRGRKTGALEQGGAEFGPVALIWWYSYREEGVQVKAYTVLKGLPEDEGGEQGAFASQLARISARSSGVYETAQLSVTDQFGGSFLTNNLTGKASLSKITTTQPLPTWFSKKLIGSAQGYFLDSATRGDFVQGQPLPGSYFKISETLTFNATETKAVNGLDFDAALQVVIDRLEAKGYVLE